MSCVIFIILGLPLILALGLWWATSNRTAGFLNAAGHMTVLLLSSFLLYRIGMRKMVWSFGDFFYMDALSAFFMFVTALITFAAALYSVEYIHHDAESGTISPKKSKFYYLFFNLFSASMMFVTVVNNMAILWVAIEMTTLISAFLVGFYNTRESVEAAWKYLIICSVGIILALLGTILFSYTLYFYGGIKSLNWTDMAAAAGYFDKNALTLAFVFILVGYGTKAGLAPLHTWLPDAHSQAVAPISALLSGVLLKTAMYAILRFGIIVNRCFGSTQCTGHFLILFGLLSLVIGSVFMLVQKDLKRLLAYSSIKHIGIITIAFGIGGPLGILGGLLHILNHAMTKSLMFFGAGDIVSVYKKHNMNLIRGVLQAMPFTGVCVLIGIFALSGFPPFAMFVSEILIIFGAFQAKAYWVTGFLLLFLGIAFGAILYHFGRCIFGKAPKTMHIVKEAVISKAAFLFLLIPIVLMGFVFPWILKDILISVADIIIKGI